jgi:hypothetical protein
MTRRSVLRRVARSLPLFGLWVVLGSILSVISASVRDWNAMTDELHYERLAISVAQTHSVVPQLHGAFVRSLAQLYPVLISPWFLDGYVPENLRNAHVFNAWLMSSACIPAYLLARRVTGSGWVAYALALLTVCTPWIVYSTTLLTEVSALPAVMWAILAMQRALARPGVVADLLALLALVVAFFARTQFVELAVVLPPAIVVFELHRQRSIGGALRASVAGHPVLVAAYAALVAAVLAADLSGHGILDLSAYGSQASGHVVPHGDLSPVAGHFADVAFGVGILPCVVAGGWLAANLIRRAASAELQAFACIAAITVTVFVVETTEWDLHIGDFALDRYLFYLVPLLLLAFFCALREARRPRLSLAVPAALVAAGFATHLQPAFLWSGRFPLSTDSAIAWLYGPIADLVGGSAGASAILVTVTLVLTAGFVAADHLLDPRRLTIVLAAAVCVALPVETALTLVKLFSRDGHSSRPLTRSEAGVLDWLDRVVGIRAHVTEVPYAISSSYLVTQEFWRDLEFWNKSVRYAIHSPPEAYADAVIWFPNNALTFDETTGKANESLTPWVVQSIGETRFRISGTVTKETLGVRLVRTAFPWRTDWLTSGLYDDGWTRPGTAARIRVFAVPGQRHAVTRTLTVQVRLPPGMSPRPVTLTWSNGSIRIGSNAEPRLSVCVPRSGYADVRLLTPHNSPIPVDQSTPGSTRPRTGGVLVAAITVADEIGSRCRVFYAPRDHRLTGGQ